MPGALSDTRLRYGALAINGVAEGVNNTAKETSADGGVDNLSGTLDSVTLTNQTIGTEDGNTDVVSLEVEGHTADTGGELYHLLGLDVAKTVDTSDTVTDG